MCEWGKSATPTYLWNQFRGADVHFLMWVFWMWFSVSVFILGRWCVLSSFKLLHNMRFSAFQRSESLQNKLLQPLDASVCLHHHHHQPPCGWGWGWGWVWGWGSSPGLVYGRRIGSLRKPSQRSGCWCGQLWQPNQSFNRAIARLILAFVDG